MSDKLEQTMKKIHIYLANCKESAYSSEELIVSKKRLFALLEELNYAVYEAKEEYEVTVSARERGIAMAERMASDIKHEAAIRAEEIHASSLLYTQEAIADLKSVLEYMHEKVRIEYEMVLMNYEERLRFLEQDSMEIMSQLETKADAKVYLRLIEEIKAKQRIMEEESAETNPYSKKVGSVASHETYAEPTDEYENKLASSIVVEVHDSPKIPEGFGNKSKKKKKGKGSSGGESRVTAQELDAEYFAFQEEQQKTLEEQISGELGDAATEENSTPEDVGSMFREAFRKLTFGNKKK